MRTPLLKPLIGSAIILGVSTGCGFHANASSKTSHPKSQTTAPTTPTLVRATRAKPTVLHPTSFMNITQGTTATTQKFTAPLQNSGNDTLSLTTNPAVGTGSLTVTNPSGQTILTLPHVGGLGILQFGSTHPPVVITQSTGNLCGSGGCAYTAYTWSLHRHRFVTIPGPTTTNFQYLSKKNQFAEVASTPLPGFFGFLSANANGINLDERLYDLWQHEEVLPYLYATNGSPGGQWVSGGAPEYTPKGPLPTTMMTSPSVTLQALLEARSLNLKTQGDLLLPGGLRDQTIWGNLRGIATWGPNLWVDTTHPKVTQGANGSENITEMISGMHDNGAGSVLKAYRVVAETTLGQGNDVIVKAHLSAVPLKVNSVLAVLSSLRANPGDRSYLTQHPGPLSVIPFGLTWQVSIGRGSKVHSWLQINAETGRATAASSEN